MILRDPLSDLFIVVCGTCGTRLHIDSDSGFGAASLAAHAGWKLGMTDYCRECPEPKVRTARRG